MFKKPKPRDNAWKDLNKKPPKVKKKSMRKWKKEQKAKRKGK